MYNPKKKLLDSLRLLNLSKVFWLSRNFFLQQIDQIEASHHPFDFPNDRSFELQRGCLAFSSSIRWNTSRWNQSPAFDCLVSIPPQKNCLESS